ncbi:MAG: alanine racemase, partial [Acidobacteria bacterium]|nr:alanine racemase [Acidobacteriota bacterium]
VGRVSMNLTVVDITDIPTAATGDEVTLLGTGITAQDIATTTATIPYDILCAIRAQPTLV